MYCPWNRPLLVDKYLNFNFKFNIVTCYVSLIFKNNLKYNFILITGETDVLKNKLSCDSQDISIPLGTLTVAFSGVA